MHTVRFFPIGNADSCLVELENGRRALFRRHQHPVARHVQRLLQRGPASCDAGEGYNNTSAVIRYSIEGGASFLWLGDLETEFMENIAGSINLTKTTIVFASHHGRNSGKNS